MGRKKVRKHASKEVYSQFFSDYLRCHKEEFIDRLLAELEFDDLQSLKEFEFSGYYGGFGLDCGWVNIAPKDSEMEHEWALDNGKYNTHIWDIGNEVYSTQSTTIKEVIVKKLLKDTGTEHLFYWYTKLD